MEQLEELVAHAKQTGQNPTNWVLSRAVEGIIYRDEPRSLEGADMCGLPILFDADLPMNKAVLKCGQNSAGATCLPVFLNLA